MTLRRLLIRIAPALIAPVILGAQGKGVDPAELLKPLADSWPTYSGDYTGRRYSLLKQVDQTTVKNLTLAWSTRLTAGAGVGTATNVGGEGTGEFSAGAVANVKGSILMVNGVLYVSAPDNAWAIDARDGHEIWHYYWKTRGGTHIGNRGLAMWHNYIYMET